MTIGGVFNTQPRTVTHFRCGRVKRMGHCMGILRRKRKGQTQPKTYGEVGKGRKVEGGEKRVFGGTYIRCRMICLSSNRRELFMVGVGSPPHRHTHNPIPPLTTVSNPNQFSYVTHTLLFSTLFLSPQIIPCNIGRKRNGVYSNFLNRSKFQFR